MKFSPAKFLILGLFLTASVWSCKVENNPTPSTTGSNGNSTDQTNNTVNEWIYDSMKYYYLWTDQMPAKTATNLTLTPDKYFETILNDYPNTDRFSWIQEDVDALTASLNGINKVFGMSYYIYYLDNTQTTVGFFINYVVKGSPAEKAGLKRGDIILSVNGTQLDKNNYDALRNLETASFGLGTISNGAVVSNGVTTTQITKVEIQDNPVHYWKVIEKGNKKIGYLVYRQFISSFDANLRQVFSEFKSKGVNELVLDLRVNGGGYISSADVLSSLIVKNLNTDNVIHYDQWNANVTAKYPLYSTPSKFRNEPNNLGTLNRLFVLTSTGTASASELVINGLRPYMDVVLIGDHTYGKNVGSVTLQDDRNPKRWKWGMQPIVLKTFNSKGESNYGTKNGFTPDYSVKDLSPFKVWGDESDPLLGKAIELITGQVAKTDASPNARKSILDMGEPLKVNVSENPYQNIKDMFITMPK
ncbi:S41 family peptidase [Emticicia fluvialis]|uniref:S41 family peptidase n=1 Tax=Emticicia fluvialis TaxID=2974474 RepID=UPI002165B781|nr:S41 family peptidase [Emticicia fluvialis]